MYTFYQFRKTKQIISIKTTTFMLKPTVYNYWRDANNNQYEKKHTWPRGYKTLLHSQTQNKAQ